VVSEKVRIVKLVPRASEVTVSISGTDDKLVISVEALQRHRLKEGIVLTPSQLQTLRADAELFDCHRAAARMLAARPHSVGELRSKLAAKRYTGDAVKSTVRKFQDQGVLDDAVYAHRQAHTLIEQRPCWRSYLVSFLRKKMIDRSLAEQTADLVLADTDEKELAAAALTRKWGELAHFDLEVAQRKAYNYLARRGFSYDAASAALERLLNQQHEVSND
jgi:regulatory protein